MARPRVNEAEKNTKISISFTPEHYNKLIKYCQEEERQLSWVIRKALDDWFEKKGI